MGRSKVANASAKAHSTKTTPFNKGEKSLAQPSTTSTANRSTMIRTQRIPEQVAIDVRRRILHGELAVGASLAAEGELMSQYGISRPTLREALRILEAEQLIRVRRGGIGGAVVRRPDMDVAARQFGFVLQDRGATMADVHRARTIIEPPALASLAVTVTSVQIAELNTRLEATNDAIGDPLRYSEAVENLRERIVEMTGAITLALIMRLLREVVQKHTAAVGGLPPDRWAKLQTLSQHSHQKLIKLIGSGNPEAAEDFWREHLAQVEHHLGRVASTRLIDLID